MLGIILTLVVADAASGKFLPEILVYPVMFGPLAIGVGLVVGRPPPARYAVGCGVLIGWPLGIIASAGLCFGEVIDPFRLAG